MKFYKKHVYIKTHLGWMDGTGMEYGWVWLGAYILKVRKSADFTFQSKKICGKSA